MSVSPNDAEAMPPIGRGLARGTDVDAMTRPFKQVARISGKALG